MARDTESQKGYFVSTISYVVSFLERGAALDACLATLGTQAENTADIVVCCNSVKDEIIADCKRICDRHGAHMEMTGLAGAKNGYESANMVAGTAKGDYLCFPSDDSLYVQGFSRTMLGVDADLVYCDCVYRVGSEKSRWAPYSLLNTQPRMGRIDKTCFIVKRALFDGFPPHPRNWCDGALIDKLVARGVKHAKASGILAVHQ